MSSPNVIDMALLVQAAIVADEAVAAYCVEKYGVKPLVSVGVDDLNPPKESEYPVVALHEFRVAGGGTSSGNISYEIDIACGVVQRAIDFDADAKTRFYRGMTEAEALRASVFTAIRAGHLGKITIRDGEVGQVMSYPLFVAFMTVVIETINTRQRT